MTTALVGASRRITVPTSTSWFTSWPAGRPSPWRPVPPGPSQGLGRTVGERRLGRRLCEAADETGKMTVLVLWGRSSCPSADLHGAVVRCRGDAAAFGRPDGPE